MLHTQAFGGMPVQCTIYFEYLATYEKDQSEECTNNYVQGVLSGVHKFSTNNLNTLMLSSGIFDGANY